MTQEQINEIKARCEAATKGKWTTDFMGGCIRVGNASIADVGIRGGLLGVKAREKIEGSYEEDIANAEFISHAHEDIPNLLNYIEELQSRIDKSVELPCKVGEWVWCIIRDYEEGEVYIRGYIFVAQNNECVLVSPNPVQCKSTISQYLIDNTAEDDTSYIEAYPLCDVFFTREEAEKALKECESNE